MADRDRPTRAGLAKASRVRLRFAADDRLVSLVRRGDATAFEILYDRHVRELLSFCRYMLGSQADAEDAVQSTFASAHRALLADDRWVDVRPWLFAIARNACLSTLRVRRPCDEVSTDSLATDDLAAVVEQREELRHVLATLRELPESQRVALVLSELHGFSQSEIGALLGVRAEQVKSYVYQARSNLISERDARSADCRAIREELATARGPALLKNRLRRHLRSCHSCQQYAVQLSRQRRQLGSFLPVIPSLALKRRALEAAFGEGPAASTCAGATAAGGSAAAATAELAGGATKALVAKLLTGVALLGVGSGATTLALSVPVEPAPHLAPTVNPSRFEVARNSPARSLADIAKPVGSPKISGARAGMLDRQTPSPLALPQRAPASQVVVASEMPSRSSTVAASVAGGKSEEVAGHGKSEEPHGKSERAAGHGKSEEVATTHGKSEEPHGKSEEAAGHGKSEEVATTHGKSEEPHGKSEEAAAHGNSEEAVTTHGKSEEPHGKSEEAAAHGNSEEAVTTHGKSEQAHVADEEAPVHGKSEEPHGKAAG
jgi:RNA polymerase sigma factor (sigma-70 family)